MKIRRSKARTVTPFANPERQFRTRREVLPAPIHNIYSFYKSESSDSDTEHVDIETLTLEQYLDLDLNNTRRRFTCPHNSTFEIKGQPLRELRKISFSSGLSDSVVKHINNVLEIASIFNAQESTLIQVLPLTLEGIAKRWFERTSTECTKSRSDLKQNFIRRFCPPAMIFKQLSEIQNFKQEEGESLFDTWERYNNLLFKCPFHDLNDPQKDHDSSIKRLELKVNHLTQLIFTHKPKHTLMPKTETFGEKVKRRILEENKEPTTTHDKLKQQLQKVVSHEIKELPALYYATFQNKLPLKEITPGSFILPCIIRNYSMSNALDDLGACISVMPYSLFKRLRLGSLKPIKMTIETADRSMQSPKGIKENVLVKISNFMFPVDFIVLDIMEDENVPIILSRPMLAITHAKIDVYGKKISLGVGNPISIFMSD
ncbi:hypothetical protein Tco_0879364 [Tanacetum coccineum]